MESEGFAVLTRKWQHFEIAVCVRPLRRIRYSGTDRGVLSLGITLNSNVPK
jgi:hypothetical protein